MNRRTLAIAAAALKEALRARLGPMVVIGLALAVPLVVGFSGQDAATRAWLTRAATVEGLRLVMPVAVIVGAAFLLKPTLKQGWTVLPARRIEYFIGMALAGAVVLSLCAAVFTAGGYAAGLGQSDRLSVTAPALSVSRERDRDGVRQAVPGNAEGLTWADPRHGEELVFDLPDTGEVLRGSIEFMLVLSLESPPIERAPVSLWLDSEHGREPLTATVESRYRMSFEAPGGAGKRLVVQPVDVGLVVGSAPARVRIERERVGTFGSLLVLLAISIAGALVCGAAVLFVRSLATAPTAVLAGLLVLAAFTMLPDLAPGDLRRANPTEALFAAVPRVFPVEAYEEFLAGRVASAGALMQAGLRLLVALALGVAGGVLFKARQIAK